MGDCFEALSVLVSFSLLEIILDLLFLDADLDLLLDRDLLLDLLDALVPDLETFDESLFFLDELFDRDREPDLRLRLRLLFPDLSVFVLTSFSTLPRSLGPVDITSTGFTSFTVVGSTFIICYYYKLILINYNILFIYR